MAWNFLKYRDKFTFCLKYSKSVSICVLSRICCTSKLLYWRFITAEYLTNSRTEANSSATCVSYWINLNQKLNSTITLDIHSLAWIKCEIPCRYKDFLLLCTLFLHPVPPTSLPSFLTSSYHLFLGLPLSLVISKFILNNFGEFYLLPFSVHAQTKVIF